LPLTNAGTDKSICVGSSALLTATGGTTYKWDNSILTATNTVNPQTTAKYVVTVTDEMISNEITRLQNRYGNMTEPETVTTEENVLNVTFTETDADGNEVEGGIKKENSLLVKYFAEGFRNKWMGRKNDDSELVQLKSAFDEKEREWIIGDLGLNKEEAVSADKYFKIIITKIGLLEKKELNEEFFNEVFPGASVATEEEFRKKLEDDACFS